MGVHRTRTRKSRAGQKERTGNDDFHGRAAKQSRTCIRTKAKPTTSLIKMRPVPGQPPVKVEYKRRNRPTFHSYSFSCFSQWI